jgi:hypothetical protein
LLLSYAENVPKCMYEKVEVKKFARGLNPGTPAKRRRERGEEKRERRGKGYWPTLN